MAGIIITFFSIVIARLAYLQLAKGNEYLAFSDQYTIKEIPIRAPRGVIYDRKGKVLATTRPAVNLLLNLQKVKKLPELLEALAPLIDTTPENLKRIIANSKDLPKFRPIVIASDLSKEQVARMRIQKSLTFSSLDNGQEDFSALDLQIDTMRLYQGGEAFGHVLGYLREVSEEKLLELQKKYSDRYKIGDEIGVQGIERSFDFALRGSNGKQELIVDALGHEVNVDKLELNKDLKSFSPTAGENIYLSIDSDLQRVAYEALQNHTGAVVTINVRTGEVYTLVSKPSYNSENLVSNFTKSYWADLNRDEHKALLNRTIQGAYPPGSTFKIITGLAALAEGVVKPNEKVNCPGYYQLGNRKFGCWLSKGHGPTDFYHAIVQSCDVYFYKMGERLGIDKISHYGKLFGFGEQTGIELDFERSGLSPNTEWKRKIKKEDWNLSDTLSASIGQGYNLVTPLQNALMIARIASEGKMIKPTLIHKIVLPNGELVKEASANWGQTKNSLSEENWNLLFKSLSGVVQDPSGTAHRSAIPGITIGGKTGTAQVVNYDNFGRKATSRATEDHAWFVSFAPVENPEVAVAVIVEHGGHGGSAAAPVAKAVIQKYFEIYHNYGKENKTKAAVESRLEKRNLWN